MNIGDVILFRQSEPNSGVYAVGHLMRGAINRGPNEFGEWGVVVGFDYKVEPPLLKSEISANVELSNMTQINGLQGSNFSMPTETGQKLLKYLKGRLKPIVAPTPVEPNYWWCNVGVSKKAALATGTLWAHHTTKNGASRIDHRDMENISKGDVVILYSATFVVAVGECVTESVDAPTPPGYPQDSDWKVPGYLVEMEFTELASPVPMAEIRDDLATMNDAKTGPLDSTGLKPKLGYLYPLSKEFGAKFMNKYGDAEQLPLGGSTMESSTITRATAELARKLLVSEEWLTEVIGQISQSKQAIFYGPPGTGKTYIGKAIAEHLATKQNVELIQFHPSYSYEDFFEGFRPTENDHGNISLEKVAGPLKRIANRAHENPEELFVLIIDEVNRGNLAKVFGELYFLLEYREEAVSLMYSKEEKFALPNNLIFMGTMNTADRSIALVDSAIRRRFKFIHLDPNVEPCLGILPRWLKANGLSNTAAHVLVKLNQALEMYEFSVGPAYFMKTKDQSEENLKLIWKYSIDPLLEEHFYGEWDEKRPQFAFTKMIP
jgi:5-methylcytosine-specific restriction protein B